MCFYGRAQECDTLQFTANQKLCALCERSLKLALATRLGSQWTSMKCQKKNDVTENGNALYLLHTSIFRTSSSEMWLRHASSDFCSLKLLNSHRDDKCGAGNRSPVNPLLFRLFPIDQTSSSTNSSFQKMCKISWRSFSAKSFLQL